MTVLEQLPARMDRFESQMEHLRTEMRDEFSAARREMRVLHEDAIGRIALVVEGVEAQRKATTALAASLDESRAETRAMFDAIGTHLTAIENRLPARRQKKR